MKALANSIPSTSQKPIADVATKTEPKTTAPASGVTTSSATRAGFQSMPTTVSAITSTTNPIVTRPIRRREKSLVSSWPRAESGRSRNASNWPVRT